MHAWLGMAAFCLVTEHPLSALLKAPACALHNGILGSVQPHFKGVAKVAHNLVLTGATASKRAPLAPCAAGRQARYAGKDSLPHGASAHEGAQGI